MPKNEIDPSKVRKLFTPPPVVLATVEESIISVGLFHTFSFRPLMVGIGVAPRRHSHRLLKKSREYGVNFPHKGMAGQVEFCGTRSGRDTDKFRGAGLTKLPATKISTALIEECPLNLECRVVEEVELGGTHTWFIGEVVAAHGYPDIEKEELLIYWNKEYRVPGEVVYRR